MTATVYTGRATNWLGVVVSGLLLVPLLGLTATSSVDTTVALVALLALIGLLAEVATASDVRVTCGRQGVSFYWGLAGWPRASYRLDDIAEATIATIPWWAVSYGLWWTPWRTVCTVRSGPALRLRLHSGRTVTVTAPDPHAAVAALRGASAGS
ncbi:hypothetical protein [Nocardioides abyssi]|uniref:PH domain-containing protein n=1 Tax=Nocardioides abyssi TaxID=3058370 RepID=A0ABT8EZG9_9ACTN|nr:hypothetical protein [Nocardioides abyssi]MDN4163439.1 hypothetical protein [Nocardioides abyssi]